MSYNSTTAQIIADRGNIKKADVMETGEMYAEQLLVIRDAVRKDYWAHNSQITAHGFDVGTQTAAIVKLSQLGLALEAVENAYSAMNTVRCF